MLKVLLAPSVFVDALVRHDPRAQSVIQKSRDQYHILPWALSSSIQVLMDQDIPNQMIQENFKGISQIPINAKLNQEALKGSCSFEENLLLEAAQMFNLNYLVSENPNQTSFPKVGYSDFLGMESEMISKVEFLDLKSDLHPIYDQMDGWYMEIIQNTAFAGGNHVSLFEKEFAQYCNTQFAIGVNSGTDALRFALIAMGIQNGDEVITVPNTFIATTEVISQLGAKPVFVDVIDGVWNMDPKLIEAKITKNTKVIVPVHLYGQPADMDPILEIADQNDLLVLEDACQAHGALYKGKKAGSMGKAAAFSMYPGKNLGAFGEAGCVTTNDPNIAEIIQCLREHGQAKKYVHKMEGYNGRMDNLQASALRAKLPPLTSLNKRRAHFASLYFEQLKDMEQIILPKIQEGVESVFHLFVIHVPNPKSLHAYLKQKQIYTGFHYPISLHLQEAYQNRNEKKGAYPISENSAERLLSLPMHPYLSDEQVFMVTSLIRTFFQT